MASFQHRLIGAVRLDPSIYEEVEHDPSATGQAAAVVVIASVTTSVAWYFGMGGAMLILHGTLQALAGWLAGSVVLWFIGTKILPGEKTEADIGQLLRVLGFAQAPGLFGLLAVVPLVGPLVPFLVGLWVIAATFIGVRQALDYDDTFRAVVVCLLGWVVGVLVVYLTGFGATVVH